MRLNDLTTTPVHLRDAIKTLMVKYNFQRVGGAERVYMAGGELAVVYLLNGGPAGVGLSWKQGSSDLSKVYLWREFNAAVSPDMVADVPVGNPDEVLLAIEHFIDFPRMGVSEDLREDSAKEITVAQFAALAHDLDTKALTLAQINQVATDNGVEVPRDLLVNPKYKTPQGRYNLAGETLGAKPKLVIMGRSANGTMFEIPGMERILAAAQAQLDRAGQNDEGSTMEEQYRELAEKVKLVASNRSSYIKSLLITGAPSSGKTFTVMETIKAMGLQEGTDYIVIKGDISDAALYQTFIEQIDSLTIFDDCDSVQESKAAKNMLKNALDTYAVRDISRPRAGSINTKVMPEKERIEFVDAISRIMRGTASSDDLERFAGYAKSAKGKETSAEVKNVAYVDDEGNFILPDPDDILDDDLDSSPDAERLRELQEYFSRKLPNRIDFRGRIIFISNMKEDEWDTAILTRAFRQNMNFSDDEMLDFIERIKNTIPAAQLTSEQKDEVLALLRQLHNQGRLQAPINFRLVQQCFDLRLTPNWEAMMRKL